MKHLFGIDEEKDRDFTLEAHAILRGTTMMRPTKMHLMALKYEISELEVANQILNAALELRRPELLAKVAPELPIPPAAPAEEDNFKEEIC